MIYAFVASGSDSGEGEVGGGEEGSGPEKRRKKRMKRQGKKKDATNLCHHRSTQTLTSALLSCNCGT